MLVREIMSESIERIARDAPIREAARLMRDRDIGMLPVEQDGKLVGTITDRDITVRATAASANPDTTLVGEAMSGELFSCTDEDDLQEAVRIMEEHQVRRLVVHNSQGESVGVLTLADLARHHETEDLSAEILEEVSQPAA
jgi:predicted transcriptional regulator